MVIPIVALLLALSPATAPFASGEDPRADRIYDTLQQHRARAAAGEQRRLPELDAVAGGQAAKIAALPHAERLAFAEPIAAAIRETGLELARSAMHLDMVRGYTDPAGAFLRTWRNYEQAWATAMDPELDRVGLATQRAEDGWIILVVVFAAELPVPDDPQELERQTVMAVNELRREHGLAALDPRSELANVARKHSEDMARRHYFAHRSPDGREVDDRVQLEGLQFRRVAENIQRNRGFRDPVRTAVDSWMNSSLHRTTILSAKYLQTGVGVAVADDGAVYFTQVFLTPPRGAHER
jgi:hypothetical protein